ncbi:hypothetical protein Peur_065240 [Populus x canadensis]
MHMEGCPDVSFKACDYFVIYGYPLHCSRVFRLYKSVFFFFCLIILIFDSTKINNFSQNSCFSHPVDDYLDRIQPNCFI